MMAPSGSIDEVCVNTIRTLCIDAIQQAKSGHPGTPMAMAPVVYTLWQDFLRFDPNDPIWPNRDRFVLSSGHASTLLYSILHLTGVRSVDEKYERLGTPSVTLHDLERFRQLGDTMRDKPQGAGLGLAISRRIVTQHGGRIWAEAAEDGGAIFKIRLPSAPVPQLDQIASTAAAG